MRVLAPPLAGPAPFCQPRPFLPALRGWTLPGRWPPPVSGQGVPTLEVEDSSESGSNSSMQSVVEWPVASAEDAPMMDLARFGQWMAEHQAQLVRELTQQQQEAQAALAREHQAAQADLVRDLRQALAANPRGGGRVSPRHPWRVLVKMGAEDDVEAYLEAFEKSAEVAGWLRKQWAAIVGSYLSGEAQAAVKAMEKADATDYDKVKVEALDRFEINWDTY